MALIEVPKEHIREPRKFNGGPLLPPGVVITKYVVSNKIKLINKDLIIEILEGVGIDVGGNSVHKVKLPNNFEILVDDAGRDLLK
jgi:hypothetical protein